VNVVMHVLLDYHWTVWAMHVQVMSMRIDRIANSATEDHANVKAAVWPVMMTMLSMLMHMVLVLMMVSYAMPRCMQRRPVVLASMVVQVVALPPMRMASVVSQRWS
jgi:hypothetical protein